MQLIIDSINPKTDDLNNDLLNSNKDQVLYTELKNITGLIWYIVKQINILLAKLVANEIEFKIGRVITAAVTLGNTIYNTGSIFNIYNASIWSVIFIVAISEVNDEEIRAVTITAVKTGDSSLINVIDKTDPTILFRPKYKNWLTICNENIILIQQAVRRHIGKDLGPIITATLIMLFKQYFVDAK